MNRSTKPLKKALAAVALGAALSAAWFTGNALVKDVQFARAQEQVEATRAQIANVQDMAAVFKAVGRAVEPSVVSIQVTKSVKNPAARRFHDDDLLRRFFPDRDGDGEPDVPEGFRFNFPDLPEEFRTQGTGSGVIVQVDGSTAYIVTNNHVAGGATEMVITLNDGREIKNAKVVGADPKSDLAVLKIQADRLIPARWGDSDKVEKGDIVLAFGSPFGYVGSMTHGIVSALNRQAGIISGEFAYENFIQVDAPINPGNSGGPLVNLRGEVIGINTAIATRSGGFQGIGFSVPSNQAKFVFDQIRERGKVIRGWLGVEIADVSRFLDEARALGYEGNKGVLVKFAMNNAPAAGKLRPGDIIIAVDGRKVETVHELRNLIAATAPGTNLTFTVFRDGKEQQTTVKVGEQPDDLRSIASAGQSEAQPSGEVTAEALGIRLADPSDEVLQRFSLDPSTRGAVVTSVKPGSLAHLAGLSAGDVITRVGNDPVKNAEDLNRLLAKKDLSKGLKLFVTNRQGSRFVFIKSEKQSGE